MDKYFHHTLYYGMWLLIHAVTKVGLEKGAPVIDVGVCVEVPSWTIGGLNIYIYKHHNDN